MKTIVYCEDVTFSTREDLREKILAIQEASYIRYKAIFEDDEEEEEVPEIVKIDSLSISPENHNGESGTAGTQTLVVSILPEETDNKEYEYSVNPDSAGVTVESDIVSWTEDASASDYVITATSVEDPSIQSEFTLTLTEPEP